MVALAAKRPPLGGGLLARLAEREWLHRRLVETQLHRLEHTAKDLGLLERQADLGDTNGNRFLLVDHEGARGDLAPSRLPFWSALARLTCHSGPQVDDTLHVGADAHPGDTAFCVIGGDGRMVTHCANGLLYAGQRVTERTGKPFASFHCGVERRPVERDGARLQLDLGKPRPVPGSVSKFRFLRHSPVLVNTGEPHAVSFVEDLTDPDTPFETLGKIVCESYGASGINWNLVTAHSGSLRIRTFERGVRRPTTSCGTGAAASFWAARHTGRLDANPAVVSSRGGEHLITERNGALLVSGRPKHRETLSLGELFDRWEADERDI